MNIGFDIDDTLAWSTESFLFRINQMYGTHYTTEDLALECLELGRYKGALEKLFGDTEDSINSFFSGDFNKYAMDLPVIDPIKKLVIEYHELGYQIFYITSRYPSLSDATEKWLYLNGFPPGILIFSKDKCKDCIDNNISIFHDDCPEVIQELAEAGIDSYLVNNNRNLYFDIKGANRILLDSEFDPLRHISRSNSIDSYQQWMREFEKSRNLDVDNLSQIALHLSIESSELGGLILRKDNYYPVKVKSKPKDSVIMEEIGDLLAILCKLSNKLGISLEDCIELNKDKLLNKSVFKEWS